MWHLPGGAALTGPTKKPAIEPVFLFVLFQAG